MTTADTVSLPTPDLAAFERELTALRDEFFAHIDEEDLEHMQKMARWGRMCTALGYGTAWLGPNLLSALLLAQGSTARWAVVMHHIGHGAYDRVPGIPEELTSRRFAKGARRYIDWLDWIHPDAWRYEHNTQHHPRTGETVDPDLVEQNVAWLRESDLPAPLKLAVVAFFASTWKLTYYAPSTFQTWKRGMWKNDGMVGAPPPDRYLAAFNFFTEHGREFWRECILPYGLARFVAAPAAFGLLAGPWAGTSVLINSVAAEILTNIQTFFVITPNHAGEDLYRFEGRAQNRAEFFRRQIVGSANYTTAGDFHAFLHGWLNYHIEHHLFAELPIKQYPELQRRLMEICEKHGLEYREESVFERARKTVDVMIGRTSMKRDFAAAAL